MERDINKTGVFGEVVDDDRVAGCFDWQIALYRCSLHKAVKAACLVHRYVQGIEHGL